jgi:hypothetical protein
MKSKLLIIGLAATLSIGVANGVSVAMNGFANGTVGVITDGLSANRIASGNVFFYTSSKELVASDLDGIATAPSPSAFFAGLLTADPGQVKTAAFTNGEFLSAGPAFEVGAAANRVYFFVESTDRTSFGAYKGIVVPALGAITINPATLTDELGYGTSVATDVSGTNSGYQLFTVPEPSVAILGALGLLGLVRRRR